MSEKAIKVSQELDVLILECMKRPTDELRAAVEAKRQEMYLVLKGSAKK